VAASTQQTTTTASNTPTLEDGTPVKLRISQTVSSAEAHVDDRVEFEVLEEITVSNVVVIPKGGIAWGTVTEAQGKRRMARGGKLEIVMDSVRLVDGQKAALRAVKDAKGGGHTGAMTAGIVATGLLFWPAAPFFLFMHGKDITIPKGTEVPTFVNGNFKLDPSKFRQTASSISQPDSGGVSASLAITSTPAGGEISVDQNFVGNAPSTISVAAGKHVVTVRKAGFQDWTRDITVSGGSVSLTAELVVGSGAGAAPSVVASKVAVVIPSANVIQTSKGYTVQDAVVVETPSGWIGVTTTKAKTGGAVIASVAPNGPAAQAGLTRGDTIMELNGTPVTDANVDAEVARYKSGSKIRVSYMRDAWLSFTTVTVSVASAQGN
jgi:hypothetical protein